MGVKPRSVHAVHSLEDLGELRSALKRARQLEAERIAREQAEQARLARERNLFAHSVGRVEPLPAHTQVEPSPSRPDAVPRQRQQDDEAALHEALSDDFDVESLLDTDEDLSFRRPGLDVEVVRKLRRGHWTLQGEIDLHGLRRDDARVQLAEFLRSAVKKGWRCVRVVHGKGHGSPGREPVLKGKVRSWLVQKEEVIAFVQARGSDGGHGALIVLLRPSLHKARPERVRPKLPFPRAVPPRAPANIHDTPVELDPADPPKDPPLPHTPR